MDPSKFTVRVTNPTMIRQERFSDSSYFTISEKINDNKSLNHYDKPDKTIASWCAPRKVQAINSGPSSDDDDIDKELRRTKLSKNLKNLQSFRSSQHARRIEELSRPKIIVRRTPRSHEIRLKSFSRQENKSMLRTNSQKDIMAIKPLIITEKPILHHRESTMNRIDKLAEPKIREPVPVNPLGKVNERALLAVASKRISELATPKYLPTKVASTDKPNPYSVNPQALKATCSPTVKLLASPKKPRPSSSNARINFR